MTLEDEFSDILTTGDLIAERTVLDAVLAKLLEAVCADSTIGHDWPYFYCVGKDDFKISGPCRRCGEEPS